MTTTKRIKEIARADGTIRLVAIADNGRTLAVLEIEPTGSLRRWVVRGYQDARNAIVDYLCATRMEF